MASVLKETRSGRTLYRIQFTDGDKRRRKMRLAGVNLKDAQAIASKVAALNAAKISQRPWEPDLAHWVANLGQELADKLSEAGLIERRASARMKEFLDSYASMRSDAEANTHNNWRATRQKLIAYFGEERDLRSIRPGDADDWRQWMVDKEYALATISKSVKNAKQFFKYAVRKRLAEANPFADLKAGGESNPERKAFIGRDVIAKVLDTCPDAEWRAIIALARFGGLRVPSELLKLEWQHIDWEGGRFTVTSDKTKGSGKAWRVVPLFPELRRYLADAFDSASEGAVFVIQRYRQRNTNLRQRLIRILRRAGVEPWERLFHNLRASRQTELANQFPGHVVCSWLGNSEAIAAKHYLTVTDEHYNLALTAGGGATGGAQVGQLVGQKPSEASGNEWQISQDSPRNSQELANSSGNSKTVRYARRDSNPRPSD